MGPKKLLVRLYSFRGRMRVQGGSVRSVQEPLFLRKENCYLQTKLAWILGGGGKGFDIDSADRWRQTATGGEYPEHSEIVEFSQPSFFLCHIRQQHSKSSVQWPAFS